MTIRFKDRKDAAAQLAERLLKYRDQRPAVLALPRGGVAIGAVVAAKLAAPLDVIFVRKIGAPWQKDRITIVNENMINRDGKTKQVVNKYQEKDFRFVYDKRSTHDDGHGTIETLPWGY